MTNEEKAAGQKFGFFFGKGKLYLFQEEYIEVIHRLEIFPTSAKPTHRLKRVCYWHIRPYTLMTINPKTRPTPMCPGKKKPWPTAPRNETPLQACPTMYVAEG